MKKAAKMQRIDSVSTADICWEDEDDNKKGKSSTLISLSNQDHKTSTPWISSTFDHTYDVKSGEFNIVASEQGGTGQFTVNIKTKEIYSRVGIHRSIPDIKSTIKTVKLLQKSELKSVDDDADNDESDTVGASKSLSDKVQKEIENNVKYGASKLVNVLNIETKEKTDYNILLTTKSNKLSITFKSMEAEKTTGERSVYFRSVSSMVASLLWISEDEATSTDSLKTIGDKVVKYEFFMATLSTDKKHIVLSSILPHDSFTSDSDVYCEIFKIFISWKH